MTITLTEVKLAARTLRDKVVEDGVDLSHARSLEIVSQQLGFRDWNTARAYLASSSAQFGSAVPVLRVQDWKVAEGFYTDYLGFAVEWVHRFEDDLPAYARLHRDSTLLDLSEHHGDGTPGSVVWLPVGDITALHRELQRTQRHKLRPRVDRNAPGGPTIEIIDPFGNVLRFCEPAGH